MPSLAGKDTSVRIPVYQVDAFASEPFRGNPAAVCPLEEWLPEDVMQAIAAEMNLAETAFFVPQGDGYHIRWFTPEIEVPLCGHATLASAAIVFRDLRPDLAQVKFDSLSGPLAVTRDGNLLELDFPARPGLPAAMPDELPDILGALPVAVLESDAIQRKNRFAIFNDAASVRVLAPDLSRLAALPPGVLVVTAPGTGQDHDVDYVVRFFAPGIGIPEDPVTGGIQTTLIPYWSERLGKQQLRARQVSKRQGELTVTNRGERVGIAGRAVFVLEGTLTI
jgi:PhzF family phenazine biosynthesis protein